MADDKKYLLKLLNLAESQNTSTKNISIFFRNKDSQYFDDVTRNGNVLPTVVKDNGGDRRSPINGRLKGVFLDTTLRVGELPSKSPFGSHRVQFPIAGIFDKTTKLYFTDFYCKVKRCLPRRRRSNRSSTINHYVTLVLSKRGSENDKFCKEHLVRLNPNTNPFLRRIEIEGKEPEFTTVANIGMFSSLHVEVFYTEEIRINELKEKYGEDRVKRTITGTIGEGRSTRGGLAKDASCRSCNPSIATSDRPPHYVLSEDDPEDDEPETTAVESGRVDTSKEIQPNQEQQCSNTDASEESNTVGSKVGPTGEDEFSHVTKTVVSLEEVQDDSTSETAKDENLSREDEELSEDGKTSTPAEELKDEVSEPLEDKADLDCFKDTEPELMLKNRKRKNESSSSPPKRKLIEETPKMSLRKKRK